MFLTKFEYHKRGLGEGCSSSAVGYIIEGNTRLKQSKTCWFITAYSFYIYLSPASFLNMCFYTPIFLSFLIAYDQILIYYPPEVNTTITTRKCAKQWIVDCNSLSHRELYEKGLCYSDNLFVFEVHIVEGQLISAAQVIFKIFAFETNYKH